MLSERLPDILCLMVLQAELGRTVKRGIGYGYVEGEMGDGAGQWAVNSLGTIHPAIRLTTSPYDPTKQRLRLKE